MIGEISGGSTATYEDTVRASLSNLEDEEIIARLQSGGLTEEAAQVAKDLLVQRGRTEVNSNISAAPPKKESDKAILLRCFLGTARLSDAFWVLGIGIWLAIGLPVALLSALFKGTPVGMIVMVLGGLVHFAALVFRDICIWRCANNAKFFWGLAARLWIVLSYCLLLLALFKVIHNLL